MNPVYVITSIAEDNTLPNAVDPTAYAGLNTVQVASLLLGVVLPILVGLVTKHSTSSSMKSILLLALACVSGFLTELVNSANFVWQQALLTSVVTFVIGVATHYGLWQPTGVTAKAQNVLVTDRNQVGAVSTRSLAIAALVVAVVIAAVLLL